MLTGLRLRMIGIAIVILLMIAVPGWDALTPHRTIASVSVLDGCYEGEGLPDFMPSARHWSLRIVNGALLDRAGTEIAKISLSGKGERERPVSLSPGIIVAGKPSTVMEGHTVNGKAYLKGSRVNIVLADELRQVFLKTTCD